MTAFPLDLAGFNAAAGNPPVVVDFDAIASGTDIGGQTIAGVTFSPSATGAPLVVVRAGDTMTPAAGFTGIIDASTNVLPAMLLADCPRCSWPSASWCDLQRS